MKVVYILPENRQGTLGSRKVGWSRRERDVKGERGAPEAEVMIDGEGKMSEQPSSKRWERQKRDYQNLDL